MSKNTPFSRDRQKVFQPSFLQKNCWPQRTNTVLTRWESKDLPNTTVSFLGNPPALPAPSFCLLLTDAPSRAAAPSSSAGEGHLSSISQSSSVDRPPPATSSNCPATSRWRNITATATPGAGASRPGLTEGAYPCRTATVAVRWW